MDEPSTWDRMPDSVEPLPPRARCGHRGTTLLLFPAGILVVMILAAIAVDLSKVHLARREAHAAIASVADDAAAMLDRSAVRRGEFSRLDLDRARAFVRRTFAEHPPQIDGRLIGPVSVRAGARPGTVELEATIEVDHLFARVMPDAATTTVFTVRVTGELLGG